MPLLISGFFNVNSDLGCTMLPVPAFVLCVWEVCKILSYYTESLQCKHLVLLVVGVPWFKLDNEDHSWTIVSYIPCSNLHNNHIKTPTGFFWLVQPPSIIKHIQNFFSTLNSLCFEQCLGFTSVIILPWFLSHQLVGFSKAKPLILISTKDDQHKLAFSCPGKHPAIKMHY